MPSFDSKKRLRFVITLGTGDFDSKGSDQIILEGYRAVADITNAGGLQMGELRGRIYGVSASDMNAITSFAYRFGATTPNTCIVYAIDGDVETMVFAGNIVNAWPDFNSPPDVFLHIQAQAALFNLLKSVPPRSFSGTIDVAEVMGQLAKSMSFAFENNGVVQKMTDPYLPGTALDQANELARSAGIDMFIDLTTLAICPKGVSRKVTAPIISASTGLVGYPMFDGVYLSLRTLFNPGIIPGGTIKVESDRDRATGTWQVLSMNHRLESEKPDGAWFTSLRSMADISTITGRK